MNWESWEEPKNSLIAATKGLGFTRAAGVRLSASLTVIRSRIIRSKRFKPTLTWFCNNSPTERTRRLPKWSMSSVLPPSNSRLIK